MDSKAGEPPFWSSSSSPCPALLYKAGSRVGYEGPVPILAVQDVPSQSFFIASPTHPLLWRDYVCGSVCWVFTLVLLDLHLRSRSPPHGRHLS
jgi:hypothetical protein